MRLTSKGEDSVLVCIHTQKDVRISCPPGPKKDPRPLLWALPHRRIGFDHLLEFDHAFFGCSEELVGVGKVELL